MELGLGEVLCQSGEVVSSTLSLAMSTRGRSIRPRAWAFAPLDCFPLFTLSHRECPLTALHRLLLLTLSHRKRLSAWALAVLDFLPLFTHSHRKCPRAWALAVLDFLPLFTHSHSKCPRPRAWALAGLDYFPLFALSRHDHPRTWYSTARCRLRVRLFSPSVAMSVHVRDFYCVCSCAWSPAAVCQLPPIKLLKYRKYH